MSRYRVKVETGPGDEYTQIQMDSPSDDDARGFIARLGLMLTSGDFELTVEERRTVGDNPYPPIPPPPPNEGAGWGIDHGPGIDYPKRWWHK